MILRNPSLEFPLPTGYAPVMGESDSRPVSASEELTRLEARLKTTSDAVERVDTLNKLTLMLRDSEPQRGLTFGEEARGLAEEHSYPPGLALSLLRLSQINARLGDAGQALPQAIRSLHLFEELDDQKMQAPALLTLGVIYGQLGDEPSALESALKALKLCRDRGDRALEAHVLNNLGTIYNGMGDYQHELQVYEQAFELYAETGQKSSQAIALNNMAMAYRSMKEPEKALAKAQQALQMAEGSRDLSEIVVLCTLGDVLVDLGDYGQAQVHFRRCITLAREFGLKPLEMEALRSLGKTHVAQQRSDLALPFLQQALEIAKEGGNRTDVIVCQQALAKACRQEGDLETALAHYEQLSTAQQELAKEEIAREMANLRVIHDTEAAQQEAEIHRLRTVELEERNAELDAFAHTVAHDLKNPLTAILAASDLLGKFSELSEEKRQRRLESISQAGRWMSSIVDALLLLADIRGASKVAMTKLDMAHLVKETLERMALMIEGRQAKVTVPAEWPVAVGYGPWVQEVWANYLSNAIKYGGTPPEIELGATPQDDGFIRFWVRDNGVGLSAEEQERLFIPFERLHQVSIKGHGLGLSIVRRIVDKLGGKVGVSNEENTGSTFYFTLPQVERGESSTTTSARP